MTWPGNDPMSAYSRGVNASTPQDPRAQFPPQSPPQGWPPVNAQPSHGAIPHYPTQPSGPRAVSGPAPHVAPSQSPPPGPVIRDFTTPVELRCILTADGALKKRAIPLAIFTFVFSGFVGMVIVGIIFQKGGIGVALAGGVVIGALVTAFALIRTRSRLERTYGEQQRLLLSPQGMRKVDGTVAIEMPWSGIKRIEERDSALQTGTVSHAGLAGVVTNAVIASAQQLKAAGIVGSAFISPLPGASRAQLRAQDRNGGSRLAAGQAHQSEQALIFPGEFEENWAGGVVGAWLRHYRPDMPLT